MAKVKIIEIPGKLISYWDDSQSCVIDTWLDFHAVSIAEIDKVLLGTVVPFIINKKCEIHVADNSKASGAFSREVSDFFKSEVSAAISKTNLRNFVTVVSENSPIANISMRNVVSALDKKILTIESLSLSEGLESVAALKRSEKNGPRSKRN